MKQMWNSLSVRILITVVLGMLFAAVMIGSIIIQISEGIFIDTYGKAQDKVFTQAEDNFNQYYENLSVVMKELDTSRGFRYVFHDAVTDEESHSIKHFNALYRLQKDMETAVTKHMPDQNLLIVGENGKTFMNHSETLAMPVQKILEDNITNQAAKNPAMLGFYYREGGFSESTKNLDVVIAVKAFSRQNEKNPYAYAYVTLSAEDLKSYYNFFVTDTNDFYILDESKKIIITNRINKRGRTVQNKCIEAGKKPEPIQTCKDDKKMLTIFYRELPYFRFYMYGVIDNKKALGELYETDQIIFYSIIIVLVVVGIIAFIVKYSLQPLQVMAKKMQKIKNGDFDEYMQPVGSKEIVELANTYNYMLDGLKQYVDTLIKTQKEKRRAEMHALQMQINPHYIYNTLTSIKWLVFQGEINKTIKTIDAFIYLLRNTISNTKEYISVKQEIENLKNYVWIQKTRYGDQIKTEFYVLQECEPDLIPKMILQPFVENAFFHGFPSGEKGMIQIYFKEENEKLTVIIQDNGIGMTKEEIQDMAEKEHEKFSGIGVKNIKERLDLLYGDSAHMEIHSVKEEGTTVKICIPIQKEK